MGMLCKDFVMTVEYDNGVPFGKAGTSHEKGSAYGSRVGDCKSVRSRKDRFA